MWFQLVDKSRLTCEGGADEDSHHVGAAPSLWISIAPSLQDVL